MLPNVKGADRTRRDILLYSLVLAPLGLTPWLIGFASPVYGALAFGLGALFLFHAARVYVVRDGEQANRFAMRMFGFSILYLFLLFAEIVGRAHARDRFARVVPVMVSPLPFDKKPREPADDGAGKKPPPAQSGDRPRDWVSRAADLFGDDLQARPRRAQSSHLRRP